MISFSPFLEYVKRNNLSISEITDRTGMDYKTVKNIYKNKDVRVNTLERLCKTFNLKISEVCFYDGEVKPIDTISKEYQQKIVDKAIKRDEKKRYKRYLGSDRDFSPLLTILKERGITAYRLDKEGILAHGGLDRIKKGTKIYYRVLKRLADYLGVDERTLYIDKNNPIPYVPRKKKDIVSPDKIIKETFVTEEPEESANISDRHDFDIVEFLYNRFTVDISPLYDIIAEKKMSLAGTSRNCGFNEDYFYNTRLYHYKPSYKNLIIIAEYLDVSISSLFLIKDTPADIIEMYREKAEHPNPVIKDYLDKLLPYQRMNDEIKDLLLKEVKTFNGDYRFIEQLYGLKPHFIYNILYRTKTKNS